MRYAVVLLVAGCSTVEPMMLDQLDPRGVDGGAVGVDGSSQQDMSEMRLDMRAQPKDLMPAPDLAPAPTCGAFAGQPCCQPVVSVYLCNGGPNVVCNTQTMRCEACGLDGKRCCQDGANPECQDASQTCARPITATSVCVRCGVNSGDPCCPGRICTSPGQTCDIPSGTCH